MNVLIFFFCVVFTFISVKVAALHSLPLFLIQINKIIVSFVMLEFY